MQVGRPLVFGALFVSTTALADAPPKPTDPSLPDATQGALKRAASSGELFIQLTLLEEQSRRAELSAEEAKSRASALRAVVRVARAQLGALKPAERQETTRGIGHIEEQLHWLDASIASYQKQATEYREDAQRLRERATRGESAGLCMPPFTIDPRGHKIWKPECF